MFILIQGGIFFPLCYLDFPFCEVDFPGQRWISIRKNLANNKGIQFGIILVYPNVGHPRRGKTGQSAPNMGARRLGQDEQYLTVREILFEV
jgi:hypothetical protein